jgi:glycosyltransferase involved in cell wall biosynthesis
MNGRPPSKVLLTGGHPNGGVASFAEALRCGFAELGLAAEVISPAKIPARLGEVRDPGVLKILSTTAVFAAPLARRAICMAHGVPCAAHQGWTRTLAILASYRMANACRGVQLVEVSEYSALHLRAIFGLRVDAVIRNPVHPLFMEAMPETGAKREAITYVGRLHCAKNVDRLLPAIRDVLDENPGLRAWIVGDGPMRPELERIHHGDERIAFTGALTPVEVRERLRRTRVFVSGNPAEPFGIAYLEALSQGCAVVMPASGGGLEIAPERIGTGIQLFSASVERTEVAAALRKALQAAPLPPLPLSAYSARSVAEAYLSLDSRFNAQGRLDVEDGR